MYDTRVHDVYTHTCIACATVYAYLSKLGHMYMVNLSFNCSIIKQYYVTYIHEFTYWYIH